MQRDVPSEGAQGSRQDRRTEGGALDGGVGGLILLIAIATGACSLKGKKEVPEEVSVEVTSTTV